MLKLKNKNAGIPGGIQFLQPESGWDTEKLPNVKGRSLAVVAQALRDHRAGNLWLAKKHGWSLDLQTIEDEIEHANALRMQSNPKWHHFLGADTGGASFSGPFLWPRPSQPGNAVGVIKKTVAGVKVLLDFLGSGGRAVAKEKAEARASTCVVCPLNKQGDWRTAFTEEAAREILLVIGILNDLKLSTSHDAKLGICTACGCVNKTKAWVPLPHILKEMAPAIKAQLNQKDPVCWIIQEELELSK